MDIKKEFYKTLAGVGFVLGLFYTIVYFKLGTWQIWTLLMAVQVVISIYKKNVVLLKYLFLFCFKYPSLMDIVKSGLYIAGIIILIRWIHGFGVIGYIIGVALISGLILFRRWDRYIETKQHIEKMIWGKPLKEFKKGKDIPKVKFSK